MNSILVLVDLTPTAAVSTDQAIKLAQYKGADVTLCNIAESKEEADSEALKKKMLVYTTMLEEEGMKFKVHIGVGDYKHEVLDYIKTTRPDLVIVATHGKKGLKQEWFGSSIFALVKSIPATTLVVSNFTVVKAGGFSKVLIPASSHEDFLLKVEQSCDVLASDGSIIILNIIKPGAPISEQTSDNIEAAEKFLSKRNVNFVVENKESVKFSIGYSKDTLEYVSQNKIDLISIMTHASESSVGIFPDVDKENLLLNDNDVAVLCTDN